MLVQVESARQIYFHSLELDESLRSGEPLPPDSNWTKRSSIKHIYPNYICMRFFEEEKVRLVNGVSVQPKARWQNENWEKFKWHKKHLFLKSARGHPASIFYYRPELGIFSFSFSTVCLCPLVKVSHLLLFSGVFERLHLHFHSGTSLANLSYNWRRNWRQLDWTLQVFYIYVPGGKWS